MGLGQVSGQYPTDSVLAVGAGDFGLNLSQRGSPWRASSAASTHCAILTARKLFHETTLSKRRALALVTWIVVSISGEPLE